MLARKPEQAPGRGPARVAGQSARRPRDAGLMSVLRQPRFLYFLHQARAVQALVVRQDFRSGARGALQQCYCWGGQVASPLPLDFNGNNLWTVRFPTVKKN